MEMSATPEVALPAADLLRGLVPDAGHLQHMPSHIDVLCGDYRRSVEANRLRCRRIGASSSGEGPLNFYSLYRAHDLHFVVYSAMFRGQFADRAAGRRRARRPADPRAAGASSPRRWPTGWRRSSRCGLMCWCGSGGGTN